MATVEDVIAAQDRHRRKQAEVDAAEDAADEAFADLQALKARVEGSKEQREAAKAIGDQIRGWMARHAALFGMSPTEVTLVEQLADDMEYEALTKGATRWRAA